MGLFTHNYDKPGPGVSPDEPRKTGLARLIEVCARDMGSFFMAGELAFVSLVPFLLGVWLAVETSAILVALLAGVLGGMIAAPQVFGVADTLLRSLRDEPGYWWDTYRRAWRRNVRASLLPGAILGLIASMQIFVLYHIDMLESPTIDLVLVGIGALLALGLATYLIPQLVLMELPLRGALLNSVLLFMGYLPRSLCAALWQLLYFGAVLLFVPTSIWVLLLGSFWLPMLPAYLIIYTVLDERFQIEKSVQKLHEQQWSEGGPEE